MSQKKSEQKAPAPQPSGAVALRDDDREIQRTRQATESMTEIQSAIMVALQFPRDEVKARADLLEACRRVSFAENVEYQFPRGKKKVEVHDENGSHEEWVPNIVSGPSVYIAREAARLWGNLRTGTRVIQDDMEKRTIECYAWDAQTNYYESAQDVFEKKVQRKVDGQTRWIPADERDLRELQNRRAAIGKRNCILAIIPDDIIDEAIAEAHATMRQHALAEGDKATKKLIDAFAKLDITPDMICQFLKIDTLAKITPDHFAFLKPIYASINDGNSRWSEYVSRETAGPTPVVQVGKVTTTTDELLGKMKPGPDNRGHDDTKLENVAAQPEMQPKTEKKDEVEPLHADVLSLQERVIGVRGSIESSEQWLARASRAVLPTGWDENKKSRPFHTLTPLEARTLTEALDSKEIALSPAVSGKTERSR